MNELTEAISILKMYGCYKQERAFIGLLYSTMESLKNFSENLNTLLSLISTYNV